MKTLSIIIPCFNEVGTIGSLLQRVVDASVSLTKEIIVVDDGSTDGSRDDLMTTYKPYIDQLICHEINQGKGAAISTGLRHANGDIMLIQDADLEYSPDDYEQLIQPLQNDEADVVLGSRFLRPSNSFFFSQKIANRFLTFLTNQVTGLHLTDMETCYKAMPRSIYTQLTIKEKRFGIEPEIVCKLARSGCRFKDVAITFNKRSRAAGKKIGFNDGIRAIWCIFYYRYFD